MDKNNKIYMAKIKQTFTKNQDGTENLQLTCSFCGGQITQSTKYGMYCDKKCGEDKDIEAYHKINDIISGFGNLMKKYEE